MSDYDDEEATFVVQKGLSEKVSAKDSKSHLQAEFVRKDPKHKSRTLLNERGGMEKYATPLVIPSESKDLKDVAAAAAAIEEAEACENASAATNDGRGSNRGGGGLMNSEGEDSDDDNFGNRSDDDYDEERRRKNLDYYDDDQDEDDDLGSGGGSFVGGEGYGSYNPDANQQKKSQNRTAGESIVFWDSAALQLREPPVGLRTWDGVFLPVVTGVLGIIVFLKLPYLVAQCGLVLFYGLLVICYLVSGLTTISIAALSTNGSVGEGGPFHMVSRNLGAAAGLAVGVSFFFGNLVTGGFFLTGSSHFAIYILHSDKLEQWIQEESYLSTVVTASILLLLLLAVAMLQLSAWFRVVTLFCTIIAIFDVIISLLQHNNIGVHGFTSFGFDQMKLNLWPDFQNGMNAESALAILFPSVGGILAGLTLSGEIRHAAKAIPRGIAYSWISTLVIYSILAFFVAGSFDRQALIEKERGASLMRVTREYLYIPGALLSCFAAALANLVGSSRVLYGMAQDHLIPNVWFFDFMKARTKKQCVLICWVGIQIVIFCIGDHYTGASIVGSLVILSCYCALNAGCFLAGISGVISFRPVYDFFSDITALLGAGVSFCMMFFIHPLGAAVIIFSSIILQFLIAQYMDPSRVHWGDPSQPVTFFLVRKLLLNLDTTKEHIRHWRPSLLQLVTDVHLSQNLMHLANNLKKGGLLEYFTVLEGDFANTAAPCHSWKHWFIHYLQAASIKAFGVVTFGSSIREAFQQAIRHAGLGAMRPNSILLSLDELDNAPHHREGRKTPNAEELVRWGLMLGKHLRSSTTNSRHHFSSRYSYMSGLSDENNNNAAVTRNNESGGNGDEKLTKNNNNKQKTEKEEEESPTTPTTRASEPDFVPSLGALIVPKNKWEKRRNNNNNNYNNDNDISAPILSFAETSIDGRSQQNIQQLPSTSQLIRRALRLLMKPTKRERQLEKKELIEEHFYAHEDVNEFKERHNIPDCEQVSEKDLPPDVAVDVEYHHPHVLHHHHESSISNNSARVAAVASAAAATATTNTTTTTGNNNNTNNKPTNNNNNNKRTSQEDKMLVDPSMNTSMTSKMQITVTSSSFDGKSVATTATSSATNLSIGNLNAESKRISPTTTTSATTTTNGKSDIATTATVSQVASAAVASAAAASSTARRDNYLFEKKSGDNNNNNTDDSAPASPTSPMSPTRPPPIETHGKFNTAINEKIGADKDGMEELLKNLRIHRDINICFGGSGSENDNNTSSAFEKKQPQQEKDSESTEKKNDDNNNNNNNNKQRPNAGVDCLTYKNDYEFSLIAHDVVKLHFNLFVARNMWKLDGKKILTDFSKEEGNPIYIDLISPDPSDAVMFLSALCLSQTAAWKKSARLRVIDFVPHSVDIEDAEAARRHMLKLRRIDADVRVVAFDCLPIEAAAAVDSVLDFELTLNPASSGLAASGRGGSGGSPQRRQSNLGGGMLSRSATAAFNEWQADAALQRQVSNAAEKLKRTPTLNLALNRTVTLQRRNSSALAGGGGFGGSSPDSTTLGGQSGRKGSTLWSSPTKSNNATNSPYKTSSSLSPVYNNNNNNNTTSGMKRKKSSSEGMEASLLSSPKQQEYGSTSLSSSPSPQNSNNNNIPRGLSDIGRLESQGTYGSFGGGGGGGLMMSQTMRTSTMNPNDYCEIASDDTNLSIRSDIGYIRKALATPHLRSLIVNGIYRNYPELTHNCGIMFARVPSFPDNKSTSGPPSPLTSLTDKSESRFNLGKRFELSENAGEEWLNELRIISKDMPPMLMCCGEGPLASANDW